MAETVILVKNSKIKQIFETMEYEKIVGSTNLSKAWLEKQKKILYTYTDKKKNICKQKSAEIFDLYNGELLLTLYSPKLDDVKKLLSAPLDNNVWLKLELAVERGIMLERLAREIERNSTLLCQLEASVRGILSTDTKTKALPLLIEYLQYYAGWAVKCKKENEGWETEGGTTVSIIADDSFLAVFGLVLGPALAAGYNVILQTEPKISLVAALIIELAENVGIPPGQIKLIPGNIDPTVIFTCMDIGVVTRFGNLQAYEKIHKPLNKKFLAITNSKAPMIVFNSGDLDSACDSVVDAAWGYQGLLPWSVDRVLVQEDIFQTFVEKLKYRLSKVKMGYANDKMADVSYPTNIAYPSGAKLQLEKVLNEAKLQGIEVYQNDLNSEDLQPTLLIGGKLFSNNVIVEDTIIPAVSVLAFRTTNEAISLANNTRYGFGASVWTENISLANEVAKKLDVGNVWINNHGNFTAAVPMMAHKDSGVGYFGGAEGFLEYIEANMFFPAFNEPVKVNNLPKSNKEADPLQSFYGGSFQKSESRLIDGVYDHPIGKDLQNAIAAANKGQQAWNKMTTLMRAQFLRKVADEINNCKTYLITNYPLEEINDWITTIYEAIAQVDNLGSVSIEKSYELRNLREAVGIIGIDGGISFNKVILGALLLGNSVIILNSNTTFSKFGVELCKIFQICGFPPGVFNIILNCNENTLRTFITHKELNVYFSLTYEKFLNKISVKDLKRICPKSTDWRQILINTTTVKNIWSSVGDSVL